MSRSVLVLDCGSSALKATAFAADGSIMAQADAPHAGGAGHRQAPGLWWAAAVAAVHDLPPVDFDAIALSGTMENLIPVAGDGTAIGEALLYSDPCGAPYLEALQPRLDAVGAAELAGNAPEPLMTAFKAAWLREHEPERLAGARWLLPGSKDYLALRLTGRAATDASCAATTGLMDLRTRQWSEPLLELFALDAEKLPPILPATAAVGGLSAMAAAELELRPGIPVINGCGDGAATTVGGGAEKSDDVSLYLGTSGWVARVAEAGGGPRPFYRLPHPLSDAVIEIAPVLSAGGAGAWAREVLKLEIDEAEALAATADRAPGEVLFLPYLSGERSPFVDLELRAGFIGLGAEDGAGRLYYAVLEGVAFAIAANLAAMGGARHGTVSLVGGGALSRVWPAIIADVLGVPVSLPPDPVSATSRGAFRIASQALGLGATDSAGAASVQPRPERADRIARQRARFTAATAFLRQLR